MSTLEDLQADLEDLRHNVDELQSAIDCAESCETLADYDANIHAAIIETTGLLSELQKLKRNHP